MLELVHGREEALKTGAEHEASRNPNLASLTGTNSSTTQSSEAEPLAKSQRIYLPKSLVHSTPLARILYHAGLVPTKSEGARSIAKGGIYIASGAHRGDGEDLVWTQVKEQGSEEIATFLVDGLLILRIGKWKVRVIEVVDDDSFAFKGLHAPGWDEWKKRQTAS